MSEESLLRSRVTREYPVVVPPDVEPVPPKLETTEAPSSPMEKP